MVEDNFEILGLKKTSSGFQFDFLKQNRRDIFGFFLSKPKKTVKEPPAVEKEPRKKSKFTLGTKINHKSRIMPYVQFSIPRIFGKLVNLSFLASYPKTLQLTSNLQLKNNNSVQINVETSKKSVIDQIHDSKSISVDINDSKYSFVYEILNSAANFFYFSTNHCLGNGFKFLTKSGCSSTNPFAKLELFFKKTFIFPIIFNGDIFHRINLHLGTIFGQAHSYDKFFLGDSIRGYKPNSISPLHQNEKIGGLSCIEISNNFGLKIKKMKFFAFYDFGFCSRQNNLKETVTSAFKSALLDSRPASLGISSGVGCNYNISTTENKSVDLSLSYTFPSKNETIDLKPFNISLDVDLF